MKTKQRMLLLGYYGADNLGDEIMLHFLLNLLKKEDFSLTAVSENPEKTASHFSIHAIQNMPLFFEWGGVKNLFRKNFYRLLSELIRTDILLVGGGDLIRDDKGWKTYFYTAGKITLALLFKTDVYLLNIGIGKPVTRYGKLFHRYILSRVKSAVVRDQRSYDVCREYGGVSCNVKKLLDIAVNIRSEKLSNQLFYKKRFSEKKYLVVSLREKSNAYNGYALSKKRIKHLAAGLDKLIEKYDFDIVFIPFQNSHLEQDKKIHDQIEQLLVHKSRAHNLNWTQDFLEVSTVIKNSSALLGMRLHALVLGTSFNIPCIAMPYDIKIYEYCSQVNLPHLLTAEMLDEEDRFSLLFAALLSSPVVYETDVSGWNSIFFSAESRP